MGLFDIFKKTDTAQHADSQKENLGMQALDQTQAVAGLLEVPPTQRDEEWLRTFLLALPQAGFRCGTPQIIAGPDGFPYFQLFVPNPGEEFQCFVIAQMIPDFLLERGYGIVINPGGEQPDWVLTYGDLLNYHLNGAFFSSESLFSTNDSAVQVLAKGDEIMIGQPSEAILPAQTRKLLRDFFELNGIQDPKVLLMMRKNGETVVQDLAFNIVPEGFESPEHYHNMMQTVTWYLPRHYTLLGLNDDLQDGSFMPL